jgi:hypothetical protein
VLALALVVGALGAGGGEARAAVPSLGVDDAGAPAATDAEAAGVTGDAGDATSDADAADAWVEPHPEPPILGGVPIPPQVHTASGCGCRRGPADNAALSTLSTGLVAVALGQRRARAKRRR